MDELWNNVLKSQFLAAIDMLEKPIIACREELWKETLWNDPEAPAGFAEFWYVAFHTLFWLDLYLSGKEEGFIPPAPFDLNELEPGLMPGRNYTKSELLVYLEYCRQKCQDTINRLTDKDIQEPCEFSWKGKVSFAELLLDNMRHVQEHSAQLSMFLGQQGGWTSRWVGRVEDDSGAAKPLA